jgi:hypothetical protein
MYSRTILRAFVALGLCALSATAALAQGGWDVWTVELRDGSRLSAAPVRLLDEQELRAGFGEGGEAEGRPVAARSRILSMSNSLRNSEYARRIGPGYTRPALPDGELEQDLVVMDDGRQVSGPVIIRPRKGESGEEDLYSPMLIQNGVETNLERVAHIKFAAPGSSHKE